MYTVKAKNVRLSKIWTIGKTKLKLLYLISIELVRNSRFQNKLYSVDTERFYQKDYHFSSSTSGYNKNSVSRRQEVHVGTKNYVLWSDIPPTLITPPSSAYQVYSLGQI